jgi:hypothetical protein
MTGAFFNISGDDFTHDLMAGNNAWIARRQFAFGDVKVCAAYAAS